MASSRFSGVFLDVDADKIEDILEEPEDDFNSLVQVCQSTIDNRATLRDQWNLIWQKVKKDPPDHSPPPDESATNEIDETLVLSPDHVQRVAQFREALRLCENSTEKYELCIQTRDKLLKEASYIE